MNGSVDIYIFLNVGAVGDHNAHGDTQGEEDLAHGIQQDLQEALDGQSLEVGRQVDCQSLKSCTGHACVICVSECQRKDCDRHDHDQHYGHQNLGTLLNALFNAVEDDPGRQQHEDHRIESRLARRSDEISEEAVRRGQLVLSCQVNYDVARDPAADDRVMISTGTRKVRIPRKLHLGLIAV